MPCATQNEVDIAEAKRIVENGVKYYVEAKDLTVSLAFIISGVLCMGFVDSESITLLGFFLLVAGIFLMIILKTGYKDKSTGFIYKKYEPCTKVFKTE